MSATIGPILYSEAVTPDDANDLTTPARALLVGVAGDVQVTYENGKSDTVYLSAGMWHPMYVRRVWASGTSATGIHAGY